jgi:hypothetical protein
VSHPTLTIIAGANGAGKSTLTPEPWGRFCFVAKTHLVRAIYAGGPACSGIVRSSE